MPVLVLLFLFLALPLRAQETGRQTTWLFGVGRTNVYDTYLSPLSYRGPQLSVEGHTRRTLKRNPRVLFQTSTRLSLAYTHNRVKTAHEPDGLLGSDVGWLRQWREVAPGLGLRLGGEVGLLVGGTYNTQNGNNPAQGRAILRFNAALGASYRLRLGKRYLYFDYQARVPLTGAMFSPQFGQSYYNIFVQGDWDHNVLLTHPGNALSLHHRLTVSLPMKRRMLTLGYESELLQAKPHNLRQHRYTRSLVIGWTLGR